MGQPAANAHTPAVSVVMSAYNSEAYLRAAIASILAQDFCDFEFIILNDGSTDSTNEILEEFAARDSRIKIISQKNQGLTKSLVKGCRLARGKYIARQDADDLSRPDRFRKQVQWLEESAARVLCGSRADKIDAAGNSRRLLKPALKHRRLRELLLFRNDFIHTSVMFRKSAYEKAGGYRPWFLYSQDYDLWCRLGECGEIGNLAEPLAAFREHPGGLSAGQAYAQKRFAAMAAAIYYARREFSITITPGEKLAALNFHPDAALNKRLRERFQTVLDFGLLQVLPEKVETARWRLLCRSFRVPDWPERLRLWSLLLLGKAAHRRLAAWLRRA